MPPKSYLRAASCLAVRPRTTSYYAIPFRQSRSYASDHAPDKPAAERPLEHTGRLDTEAKGPNMDQLPHVSEEAAAMSNVKNEQGPEVEQQGTPIQDVGLRQHHV